MDRNHIIEGQGIKAPHWDSEKLETVICLESLLQECFEALSGLLHNQTIRKECQQFIVHAHNRQEDIGQVFSVSAKSEASIREKIEKYTLELKPLHLPLRAVLNLAINLTTFKLDIYKHFSRTLTDQHDLFNDFLEDTVEEIDFLRHEREFHQNRVNTYLEQSKF